MGDDKEPGMEAPEPGQFGKIREPERTRWARLETERLAKRAAFAVPGVVVYDLAALEAWLESEDHESWCGAPRDASECCLDVLAEAEADRGEASAVACTGITASWCPVHGDCSCSEPDLALDRYPSKDLDDPGCPLHSSTSNHPGGP